MFEKMLGDREGFSWFFEKDGIEWVGSIALFLFLFFLGTTIERTRLSLVRLVSIRHFWLQATEEGEHDKSIRIAGILVSNVSDVLDEGFEAGALALIDWQFFVLRFLHDRF